MPSVPCLLWFWLMPFPPILKMGVSPRFPPHCACQYFEDSKSPLTLSAFHKMASLSCLVFLPGFLMSRFSKFPWNTFTYLFFRWYWSVCLCGWQLSISSSGFYRFLLGFGHHLLGLLSELNLSWVGHSTPSVPSSQSEAEWRSYLVIVIRSFAKDRYLSWLLKNE